MTRSAIPVEQNTEPFLKLLRARSHLFVEVKRCQWVQFVLTVCTPFVLGLVGIFVDAVRPYSAVATLLITVVDTTAIDREFRRRLKAVARICERFDCDLLRLRWKTVVAGKPVDPEDVGRAARAWRGGDRKLLNWYPVEVARAPLEFARFVCQRTNLWYDSALRRGYAKALWAGAILASAILTITAGVQGLDLLNFVLSIVPAAPLMIWAIREALRQTDAAAANDMLRGEVESAIASFLAGDLSERDAADRARDIQDGIFQRRVATSPVLISQIYGWRRSGMEQQMNEGADSFLTRAGY